MPPILSIQHLSKRFGAVQAVQDVSFEVNAGEIFGFLGPNGAGKTTTISMICGLLEPDGGTIHLNGSGSPAQARERIGVCPQSLVLWERLTCLEQLEFIGQTYGVPRAEARRRGAAVLEALGLAEQRGRLAGALSGGMQRRLNLALALVHEPDLLILDEHEAGLDPQSRVLVREYIRAWSRSRPGRTVIFTTHNMDEAERLVDRVGIIDHGRLLVLDTLEALKHQCGQSSVLEIALKDPSVEAQDVLAAVACLTTHSLQAQPMYHEGLLSLRCASAVDTLPAALDALKRAGFAPAEARIRENTLEDVFLALTGRRLRE